MNEVLLFGMKKIKTGNMEERNNIKARIFHQENSIWGSATILLGYTARLLGCCRHCRLRNPINTALKRPLEKAINEQQTLPLV